MFNLVRTFGRIPVVTAYCRDVLDAREHRPRSYTEIYDQILRDLTMRRIVWTSRRASPGVRVGSRAGR